MSLCSDLGRQDSQNPPGDTSGMASVCCRAFDAIAGVSVEKLVSQQPKINLVARLRGAQAGRRLVMNGHLDTGPVADPEKWTVPPFGGIVRDGRIYGRGIGDMKAGIAANVMAMRTLAAFREHLKGELILMLVADEGTGGRHGTQHVLTTRPDLAGDAMLSGDAGSSRVARVGEKGFLFIEIEAFGKSAPGAQPHRGDNAIQRLIPAVQAMALLEKEPSPVPASIKRAIEKAGEISETINGKGETRILTHTTVSVGLIQGGIRVNNVPSKATAQIDIRIPPGLTVAETRAKVSAVLDGLPNVSWRELDSAEPNATAPDEEIARTLVRNAETVVGKPIGVSIRPGFSDGRFFRQLNVPTITYGLTPYNGNAPDEYILIEELGQVFSVHTLSAFDYLVA